MLDQPVPNPLAKNPNVYTHKVFATVGLILIGVIIAVAGIWYYVDGQSGTTDTATDETTTTKISTASAKKVEELQENTVITSAWKTYSNKNLGVSFKYPEDFKYPTEKVSEYISLNTQENMYEDKNVSVLVNKNDNLTARINQIKEKDIGESRFDKVTRLPNLYIDGAIAVREAQEGSTTEHVSYRLDIAVNHNSAHYDIVLSSYSKDLFEQYKSNFEQIVATLKFL